MSIPPRLRVVRPTPLPRTIESQQISPEWKTEGVRRPVDGRDIMDTLAPLKHPTSIGEIAEATSGACLATRVRQLSRIITRVYDDALRPLGITASQFTLLTQLAHQDGITAVEIGGSLDIEKSTLSRNLKRLLALGHLTMDPPAGRRGRGLHLTPKGSEVIQKAYPVWREAQGKSVGIMGPESRTTLDALLVQAERLAAA